MVRVRSDNEKTASAPAALTEIARLLARQAARELSEQRPEDNQPIKPDLSEDRS